MPSLTRIPWLHALEYAGMQSRPTTLIAQLHDVALREAKPGRIGWIDEHLGSLFPR